MKDAIAMNLKLIYLLTLLCISQLQCISALAQSNNGGSDPNRTNWFPNAGNVGVGTRTPSEALEVLGNVRVSQTIFTNSLETQGLKTVNLSVSQDASIGRNFFVQGRVAIGESNPAEQLEISGNTK